MTGFVNVDGEVTLDEQALTNDVWGEVVHRNHFLEGGGGSVLGIRLPASWAKYRGRIADWLMVEISA